MSCRIRVTRDGADVDLAADGAIRTVGVALLCGAHHRGDAKRLFPPAGRFAGFVPIHLVTFPVTEATVLVQFEDKSSDHAVASGPAENQWASCARP